MNAFVNAIDNQEARTENDMKARKSTASPCVDLFYKIGAMRGQNVIPAFTAAFVSDKNMTLRIAQWARDVRGGAGERKIFRDILSHLEESDPDAAIALMRKVPELGRWDDLFVFKTDSMRKKAFALIEKALNEGNGLCAKWVPRKGADAVALRNFLGMTPKKYRKTLVNLTKVVETQMCAKDWNNINFSHVPSLAAARYKKAFFKNAKDAYSAYLEALKNGDPTVKVNAGAVYPYDVIKTARNGDREATQLVISQWNALPNYVGDANILPMVDVSGSMEFPVSGANVTAMDVALSLGLYLADKNTGDFKDCFLTFSGSPELLKLRGNIIDKMNQMESSSWGMNTNLHAAFELILKTAKANNVPGKEMPKTVLILSDMQFDSCVTHDDSAIEMIARKYENAGYNMPKVVFWNLRDAGNVPVKFDASGVALVSGFSPAIMKSILAGKEFTPEAIMMDTIMNPRYDL
jgi:hypothetical protein